MANVRLIGRLDIKGPNLIKGVHLEGLRVMGDPQAFATRYYEAGIDELIYIDAVASLYGRNSLTAIVQHAARDLFVPLTVGGGIRSVDDVRMLLRAGADKIAINTAATKHPELIRAVSETFGSQCMVLSIEAKKRGDTWEVMTENGREHTGRNVVEWAHEGVDLGAGEILLTSVDREGTRKGFDCELVRAVATSVSIPVIASGGMGSMDHLTEVIQYGRADAVAMADVLHYNRLSVAEIRGAAALANIPVREVHEYSSSSS
jgi:cyclase